MRRFLPPLALVLLAVGCDTGPSGPGDVTGRVLSAGPALGGAVLEVSGKGIEGFSGSGGTYVYWAPQAEANTYRVIVVGPMPGNLEFKVAVQDRGARKPRATLVNLVDGENVSLPATNQYRVRFADK